MNTNKEFESIVRTWLDDRAAEPSRALAGAGEGSDRVDPSAAAPLAGAVVRGPDEARRAAPMTAVTPLTRTTGGTDSCSASQP